LFVHSRVRGVCFVGFGAALCVLCVCVWCFCGLLVFVSMMLAVFWVYCFVDMLLFVCSCACCVKCWWESSVCVSDMGV